MNLKKLVSIGLSFLFATAIPAFSAPTSFATSEEEIEIAIEQQNEKIERLESKIENIKTENTENTENIETLEKEVKKIKKDLKEVKNSKSSGRGFLGAIIKKTSAAGATFVASYALLTSTDKGAHMSTNFAQSVAALYTALDPRRENQAVPNIRLSLGSLHFGASDRRIDALGALGLSAIAALCAFVFA